HRLRPGAGSEAKLSAAVRERRADHYCTGPSGRRSRPSRISRLEPRTDTNSPGHLRTSHHWLHCSVAAVPRPAHTIVFTRQPATPQRFLRGAPNRPWSVRGNVYSHRTPSVDTGLHTSSHRSGVLTMGFVRHRRRAGTRLHDD